jgi:hypothetical protein
MSAYRQFIRHSLEALIESDYLQPESEINRQIDQLIEFETKLQNVSFAIPLNMDLDLFNFTTFEPTASIVLDMLKWSVDKPSLTNQYSICD